MNLSVIGLDIAKLWFELCGLDEQGKRVLSKRLRRGELMEFFANLPRCDVAMESCSGANHWGRELTKLGFRVKLIAPQFVKPFVKSQKNDRADALAIAEAASRPTMRFVPVKTIEQQDLQALHRIRERLVANRTALVNEIRGLLCEYGIVIPQALRNFRKEIVTLWDKHGEKFTSFARETFSALLSEYLHLEKQILAIEQRLKRFHIAHPVSQRLATIPGIAYLTATAIIASVSEPCRFRNGREFSASLGLVPQQRSSGGKAVLLGVSKRGNSYLRKLLVNGARAVMLQAHRHTDPTSRWIKELQTRVGHNKAAVAVANKNARIVWCLLTRNTVFSAQHKHLQYEICIAA